MTRLTPWGRANDPRSVRSVGSPSNLASPGAISDRLGLGRVYEVKDGKLVARLFGAGFLFRATELWKGVKAVGGAESARRYGVSADKGEPAQRTYHSVTAPPAVLEQVTFVDIMRKA